AGGSDVGEPGGELPGLRIFGGVVRSGPCGPGGFGLGLVAGRLAGGVRGGGGGPGGGAAQGRGPRAMNPYAPPNEPHGDGGPLALRTAGDPRTESAATPHGAKRGRRRWALLGASVLLLAGGAAGAWWWLRPPPDAPEPPSLPSGIQEPDVRAAIEAARQRVLKEPRSAA